VADMELKGMAVNMNEASNILINDIRCTMAPSTRRTTGA